MHCGRSAAPKTGRSNFCTHVERLLHVSGAEQQPKNIHVTQLKVSNSQTVTAPPLRLPTPWRPTLPSVWQVEDRMVLGGRKRYGR